MESQDGCIGPLPLSSPRSKIGAVALMLAPQMGVAAGGTISSERALSGTK
jgi:hypothetical protein